MSYHEEEYAVAQQQDESEAPPIPRRKLKPKKQLDMEEPPSEEGIREPTLVTVQRDRPSPVKGIKKPPVDSPPAIVSSEFPILELVPDTVIGKTVVLKGELSFDKLLRIDGRFEGDLVSNGSLIVGPSGVVIGHIEDFEEVLVDGKVYGDILATSLIMRSNSQVYGNVNTKSLVMQSNCVLVGYASVHPYAPQEPTIPADIANAIKRRDAARYQAQEETDRRTKEETKTNTAGSASAPVTLPSLVPTSAQPPSQPPSTPPPPSTPATQPQPSAAKTEVSYSPSPPTLPPADGKAKKSFFGKK